MILVASSEKPLSACDLQILQIFHASCVSKDEADFEAM